MQPLTSSAARCTSANRPMANCSCTSNTSDLQSASISSSSLQDRRLNLIPERHLFDSPTHVQLSSLPAANQHIPIPQRLQIRCVPQADAREARCRHDLRDKNAALLTASTNTNNALADSRNAAVLYLAALEFWRVQLLADAIQQHLR